MAQRRSEDRKPKEPWRVVGDIIVDLPRDPYPFAEHRGGAERRKGARIIEHRPGWGKGRKLLDVLQDLRNEYRSAHVEHWPFGPSEDPDARLIARFSINRRWNVTDANELQIQLDEEGRAEWIAIRSPKGLSASEVARLPWPSLFTVADAIDRSEGARQDRDAIVTLVETKRTLEARRRPPRPPKVRKRPGRAGHSDEHYEKVAERYLALRARGVTNPTKTIADEWHQARSTVAGWVHEARKRDLLPPARPGRAG